MTEAHGTRAERTTSIGDYPTPRQHKEPPSSVSSLAKVGTLGDLEAATGRDRWSLSHDFRMFYGPSPYRFQTIRRLDTVRHMLLHGTSLADAAVAAGLADQSHMTRHFTKTFGLTPGAVVAHRGWYARRLATDHERSIQLHEHVLSSMSSPRTKRLMAPYTQLDHDAGRSWPNLSFHIAAVFPQSVVAAA